MSTASPTAYLLWAILSILFLGFMLYHLWSYDRFHCLHWSSGRQPGAFKRIMTYSYLGSVPLFVVYSVATTVIKFKQGYTYTPDHQIIPTPLDLYSPENRRWILPLNFIFSIVWGLELITHLEELAFWLYLLHQNPDKEPWFDSWEYRLWFLGSVGAILGMPLTAVIARHNVDTLDAWIFLVGSSGSAGTNICFLYVLWRFPQFIKNVKAMGADPAVVVRLATFYQLNLARIIFRFLYAVPLFVLALDGITGTKHSINMDVFWTDFLIMVAGIGCFVSTMITLLIFFPRSMVKESGYKPKPPTTLNSPKSPPITPPILMSGPFESSQGYHGPPPTQAETDEWYDDEETSTYHPDHAAPPYAGSSPVEIVHSGVQFGPQTAAQPVYQRQPFPHSLSSPHILTPPFSQSIPMSTVPESPLQQVRVARQSRRWSAMAIPVELHRQPSQQSSQHGQGLGFGMVESSTSTLGKKGVDTQMTPPSSEDHAPVSGFVAGHRQSASVGARAGQVLAVATRQHARQRSTSRQPVAAGLHPYLRTFTSPIDLVDLEQNDQLPTRTV